MGVAVERSGDKNSTVWLQFVNTDIAAVARSLGAMTGRQVLVDTQDI
jgi:type II secretory pathway component GspD/PulD (secretin)